MCHLFIYFPDLFHVTVHSLLQLSSYVRFFKNLKKDFTLNVSCCLNSSAYEKWGFPVQTFKFLYITLKTFLKHTCQCQLASFYFYVNKEMFSTSFFKIN